MPALLDEPLVHCWTGAASRRGGAQGDSLCVIVEGAAFEAAESSCSNGLEERRGQPPPEQHEKYAPLFRFHSYVSF